MSRPARGERNNSPEIFGMVQNGKDYQHSKQIKIFLPICIT
ncbi:hypothetical protein AB6G04_14300 [Proteus mirabilis]